MTGVQLETAGTVVDLAWAALQALLAQADMAERGVGLQGPTWALSRNHFQHIFHDNIYLRFTRSTTRTMGVFDTM